LKNVEQKILFFFWYYFEEEFRNQDAIHGIVATFGKLILSEVQQRENTIQDKECTL